MYSKEELLAKINQANGTSFDDNDLILGLPQANTGTYNTVVLLDGVEAEGYTGFKNVQYNRLVLSDIIPPDVFWCYGTGKGPASAILDQLKAHGVDLTGHDVVNTTVNYASGTYTLQIDPHDYKWSGSTTIKLAAAATTLSGTVNVGAMTTPTVA